MSRAIQIPAANLRYVLPHVGKEGNRPALHGVHIAPDGTMTATNGATLAVFQGGATMSEGAPAVVLIFREPKRVGAAKVENLLVELPLAPNAPAVVTLYDRRGAISGSTLADMGDPDAFPSTSAVFAGWADRLLDPDGSPLSAIALDPARVALFKVEGVAAARFTFHRPERGVLVSWEKEPRAVGLLMPCRDFSDMAPTTALVATLAGEPSPDARTLAAEPSAVAA